MIDWLKARAGEAGIASLLAMMVLFDSISKLISLVGDGILALLVGAVFWWSRRKKRNAARHHGESV